MSDDLKMFEDRINTLEHEVISVKKENASLYEEIKELRKQNNLQYLLFDIYQINSKYDNTRKNLSTSLRTVAEYIGADMAFILKAKDEGCRPYVLSTIKTENPDLDEKLFNDFFKLEDYFKDIVEDTRAIDFDDNSREERLHLPIFDKTPEENSALPVLYGIKRLSMIPIFIDKDNLFYLGVANTKEEKDLNSLEYFAGAYRDILERIVQQKIIEKMAKTDNATGLYDRGYFNKKAEEFKHGYDGNITFIMLDLYRLKFVNDNFGHDAGDRYIELASNAIKEAFKKDMTFRYGGDEFCIICRDNTEEQVKRKLEYVGSIVEETCILTNEQLKKLQKLEIESGEKFITHIDTGYAISNGNDDFDSLMIKADAELSNNKSCFYEKTGAERRK